MRGRGLGGSIATIVAERDAFEAKAKDATNLAQAAAGGYAAALSALERSEKRVAELLAANNAMVEHNRADRALLREVAVLFRFYEQSHRRKIVPDRGDDHILNKEALRKAERNAEIARRIEARLA